MHLAHGAQCSRSPLGVMSGLGRAWGPSSEERWRAQGLPSVSTASSDAVTVHMKQRLWDP